MWRGSGPVSSRVSDAHLQRRWTQTRLPVLRLPPPLQHRQLPLSTRPWDPRTAPLTPTQPPRTASSVISRMAHSATPSLMGMIPRGATPGTQVIPGRRSLLKRKHFCAAWVGRKLGMMRTVSCYHTYNVMFGCLVIASCNLAAKLSILMYVPSL